MRALLVGGVVVVASITPALAAVLAPKDIQSTFFNGQPFTSSTMSNVKFKMVFTPDGKMTREPAAKTGAKAEGTDLPDHLDRHERAEHAGQRAENAGLRAGGNAARRRRLGEQAAVGRVERAVWLALVGPQRRKRAVEHPDGSRDQGLFRKEA